MKLLRSPYESLVLWLAEMKRRAGAWRWGSPIVRATAALLGLLVLAAIGRSALARGANRSREIDPTSSEVSIETPTGPGFAAPGGVSSGVSPPPAAVPSVDAAPPDGGDSLPRGRATPDDPVYLNQATVADLRRLPGVGAKRAQAILALRDRIQRFRQIEDLLKVKGLGRASVRKLRPLVRLDLPPSSSDAGSTPRPPSPG
jgi:competence protein ComEA